MAVAVCSFVSEVFSISPVLLMLKDVVLPVCVIMSGSWLLWYVRFTCMKGLFAMMKELQDLAGQHEQVAESMSKVVLKDLQTAIQEVKQERKRVIVKCCVVWLVLYDHLLRNTASCGLCFMFTYLMTCMQRPLCNDWYVNIVNSEL